MLHLIKAHPFLTILAILVACFLIVLRLAYVAALWFDAPQYRVKKRGKVINMQDDTDITRDWKSITKFKS
jgi:hypothetical protein